MFGRGRSLRVAIAVACQMAFVFFGTSPCKWLSTLMLQALKDILYLLFICFFWVLFWFCFFFP